MQRVAGAKAIPCARRADGAPQQARTSPGKAGKVRADAPRDTRRTGSSSITATAFALPQKGEYGGAGGVEGEPLSPHAPRRGGDLPPVPGSSRRTGEAGAPGGAGKRFYDRQNKFVVLADTPANMCLSSPGAEENFIVKKFSSSRKSRAAKIISQGFLRG